jgi:UDP-glucose 4-epimerase
MARFILQMMRGERPVIYGDGEQGRDFTYVENVVQANLQAVHAEKEKVAGKIFNIACGERHSLNQVYRGLASLLRFDKEPEYGVDRRGDVRDSLADISAAAEAFGYRPAVGFEEGLQRTVEWYVRQTAIAARVAQASKQTEPRLQVVPTMGKR